MHEQNKKFDREITINKTHIDTERNPRVGKCKN